MTLLQRRRPRPFVRFNRAQYEQMITSLRDEITRQIAARRAHAGWIASYLEQRAASHELDARDTRTPADRRLAHRMAADDLRHLAYDIEKGPS